MSFIETALLGALAGATIFVGLPIARMELLDAKRRLALAMFAVGILIFLLIDVMGHGFSIAEEAVEEWADEGGGLAEAIGLPLLLLVGFGLGSAGLALFERRMRLPEPPIAGGATDVMSADDEILIAEARDMRRQAALRTGLVVAAAIGLHNFAEGLAIGVSAGSGEIALATVLIIGFALHNATEGFAIVGPLAGTRPSWGWLGAAGAIAGGPVFLGSMIGYGVESEPLELAFYGLAGGAILYVVYEIVQGVRRLGHRELGMLMLTFGLSAGLITELVIEYGGG